MFFEVRCQTSLSDRPASITGRTHVPPRIFKEAPHLSQQREMLLQRLGEINPLNARRKDSEVEALLKSYIPGVEKMKTMLKKYNEAYKELQAENARLEAEVDSGKESVFRKLQIMQQLKELDTLRDLVENIPRKSWKPVSKAQSRTTIRNVYKIPEKMVRIEKRRYQFMEINVNKEKKLVDIWLTRAERDDEELREKLKPLYAKYHAMKYLVTVFESGDEDLRESVLGLLKFNRKRLQELEQQREKKSQKTAELEI